MSSIMRARNALTGRGEEAEVIGGVLFELKVAGPSMLGIGCPDRHPLPLTHSPPPPKMHPPRRRPPARAGSFHAPFASFADRCTSVSDKEYFPYKSQCGRREPRRRRARACPRT